MQKTLQQRIDEQEVWTFAECLGLATDYSTKVRMVIASVYARGKTYVERDLVDGNSNASNASNTKDNKTTKNTGSNS